MTPDSAHRCPPYCHHCPDMQGHVFPHCWGSVDRDDLLHCYCPQNDAELFAAIERKTRELADLTAQLRYNAEACHDA